MTGQTVPVAAAAGGLRSRALLVLSYVIAAQLLTGYQPWRLIWPSLQVPPLDTMGAAVAPPAAVADLWSPMAGLLPPGYDMEEQFLTTQDGYILRMFHIQSAGPAQRSNATTCRSSSSSAAGGCGSYVGESSGASSGRPAILMQHALMDSSAGWLILGPQRSLALQLADAGFSVWLANSRGNRFSRNHTHLSPDSPEFWRFTWDDMATHDMPAMTQHVLSATGREQLVYMGYSQGTTIGLAALSSQPALRARISLAMLIAPVAIVANLRSTPFVLSTSFYTDALVETGLGWNEWGSHAPRASAVMQRVCEFSPWLCSAGLEAICGANARGGRFGMDTLLQLYHHFPAGTSVRNMQQWAQNIRRRNATHMHAFDFGDDCTAGSSTGSTGSTGSTDTRYPTCNQHAYGGATTPPAYNFTAINTPLALFTGDADTLSTTADVELLKGQLPPGAVVAHHHVPEYAHLDWEIAEDAHERAYPRLLQLAAQYSS